MQTSPRMTRAHYEFIADTIGPLVSWPSHLHVVADELAATNPRFDKEKFLRRAIKAWEDRHDIGEIDDEIPTDFRDVLAKIDRHIDYTMNHIISLGLGAGDERHFIKVLEDLYSEVESAVFDTGDYNE